MYRVEVCHYLHTLGFMQRFQLAHGSILQLSTCVSSQLHVWIRASLNQYARAFEDQTKKEWAQKTLHEYVHFDSFDDLASVFNVEACECAESHEETWPPTHQCTHQCTETPSPSVKYHPMSRQCDCGNVRDSATVLCVASVWCRSVIAEDDLAKRSCRIV